MESITGRKGNGWGTLWPVHTQAYVPVNHLFMAIVSGLVVTEGHTVAGVFGVWCTCLSIVIITTVKRDCQAENEHL
jgi:hypothetical protein